MKPVPLVAIAALPLLLLAADFGPDRHEIKLQIEGAEPQFLNRNTDIYTIHKITDAKHDYTILLDQHTGRSWILTLEGNNMDTSPGWMPLVFHHYTFETTNRYNSPLSATTNTPTHP